MTLVTVEFVGGPWEGQVREYPQEDLAKVCYVGAYPAWARHNLAEALKAPDKPPWHRHEYHLHRYGDRLEYVHNGRLEE